MPGAVAYSILACAAVDQSAVMATAQSGIEIETNVEQRRPAGKVPVRQIRLDVDNDSFVGTDRYYTNGIRLSLTHFDPCTYVDGQCEFTQDTPVRCPSVGDGRERRAYRKASGWSLGNNLYTGEDIRTPSDDLPPDDRPYAGWSYVSRFWERVYSDDRRTFHELAFGCIGPCSGSREIQTEWHEHVVPAPEPRGWDSQIGNEWVVLYNFLHRPGGTAALRVEDDRATLVADLHPEFRINIGNLFTNIGAGGIARLRLGNMRSYFRGEGVPTVIPSSPELAKWGVAAIEDSRPDATGWLGTQEAFLFGRVDTRLIGYNATLEGNLFGDDSPFTQDPVRAVVDLAIGVALHWRRLSIVASYQTRSTEVEAQPWSLTRHRWATLNIAFRC